MKFRQPFKPFDIHCTPAGNEKKMEYVEDSTGTLHKNGEIEISDEIQSHAGDCKLDLLIERIKNNDPNVCQPPNFVDLTNVPANVREMQENIRRMEYNFSQLPEEVKVLFNHSPNQYIAEAGTEGWYKKLERMKPADEPTAPNQEVKTE